MAGVRHVGWMASLCAALLMAACGGGQPPAPKSAAAPTTAPPAPAAAKPAASPAAPAPAAPAASPAAAAPAPSPAASAKAPVELWAAVISNLNYTPFFVGVDQGIFLKHGIDMKLKVLNTAPDVVKALQAGDAQFTVGTWSGLAPAKIQGVDLKIFYLLVSEPWDVNYDRYSAILVRPGLNATKMEDLKGLKIGFAFGSGTDTYVRQHLAKAGLKPEDVQLQNIQTPNIPAAMAAGNLDAAGTAEPYGILTQARAPGTRELVRGGNVTSGRIMAATSSTWLDRNPALAEQVWAALAESSQITRQNPDKAVEAASRQLSGMEVPILRKALEYLSFDPRLSAKIEQAFEQENKTLVEQKKMPSEPKLSETVAASLMREYQKKYAQSFSDLKPLQE